MIHTLEAFDKETGYRVKRGTVVQTATMAYELVDVVHRLAVSDPDDPADWMVIAIPRGGTFHQMYHPETLGLFVRDLTKPDYSKVRTGLAAWELMESALADLTLRTVAAEGQPEPAEGF